MHVFSCSYFTYINADRLEQVILMDKAKDEGPIQTTITLQEALRNASDQEQKAIDDIHNRKNTILKMTSMYLGVTTAYLAYCGYYAVNHEKLQGSASLPAYAILGIAIVTILYILGLGLSHYLSATIKSVSIAWKHVIAQRSRTNNIIQEFSAKTTGISLKNFSTLPIEQREFHISGSQKVVPRVFFSYQVILAASMTFFLLILNFSFSIIVNTCSFLIILSFYFSFAISRTFQLHRAITDKVSKEWREYEVRKVYEELKKNFNPPSRLIKAKHSSITYYNYFSYWICLSICFTLSIVTWSHLAYFYHDGISLNRIPTLPRAYTILCLSALPLSFVLRYFVHAKEKEFWKNWKKLGKVLEAGEKTITAGFWYNYQENVLIELDLGTEIPGTPDSRWRLVGLHYGRDKYLFEPKKWPSHWGGQRSSAIFRRSKISDEQIKEQVSDDERISEDSNSNT